jgi:hypothetical protein
VLAQKLVNEQSAVNDKINKAFRLIVCRRPTEQELTILLDYYTDQLQLFKEKKLDPQIILKVGEYKMDEKADKTQSAALMKTINTIYNLEETITKG